MRVAGDAASRLSDKMLTTLRAEFALHGSRIAKGDADAFIAIDSRLHSAIYEAADNKLISQILLDLRDRVQWIRRVCSVSMERVQDGFSELECVLSALERRDEVGAAQAMNNHIRSAAAFCARVEEAGASSLSVQVRQMSTA
jgi:DNA-binding GntR family transcriptional regulator